jgi:hypothetical protein
VTELPAGVGMGGKPDQQKFTHSRCELGLAAIFFGRALRLGLRIAHSLGQHLPQLSLSLGRLAGRFPLDGILGHSQYMGMTKCGLNPRRQRSGLDFG